MTKAMTQEERQLIKLIEKLPFSEEVKNDWAERIQGGNMSAELGEEIRQKLTEPLEGEDQPANRARYQAELVNIVRRWRLSSQAHNFGRR